MTRERRRAEEVARGLFTNGHGEEAQRLVLELPGKRDGGGWCLGAVTDRIEAALLAERARATRSALDGLARWVERIEDGVPPLQRTGMVWISEVAREARARGRKR